MEEIAIKVENLKICYKSLKKYSIKRHFFKRKDKNNDIVEAVRGVSFEIHKGEIVGIIGKNGCGKSTLLRALAGIFSPDEGSINISDKSVSLLAIGVGFQKELSGRENIMLSGMLLGFSEKEILDKMDEIIAFSELNKFIDMPVSTYSSGMYSKLAFSITAVLETDIMLIDEVLSVGDQKFKKKSLKKMTSLIADENRTVVIVSHSITTLRSLCQKMIWMEEGKIVMYGDTQEVLDKYEAYMDKA